MALVGYFSAKQKDYTTQMDEAAHGVAAFGGKVVVRFVQRRGVSDGGVAAMTRPFSSRTLLRAGKVREVAAACTEHDVDVVAFVNGLTEHQRQVLSETFGTTTISLADHLRSDSDGAEHYR